MPGRGYLQECYGCVSSICAGTWCAGFSHGVAMSRAPQGKFAHHGDGNGRPMPPGLVACLGGSVVAPRGTPTRTPTSLPATSKGRPRRPRGPTGARGREDEGRSVSPYRRPADGMRPGAAPWSLARVHCRPPRAPGAAAPPRRPGRGRSTTGTRPRPGRSARPSDRRSTGRPRRPRIRPPGGTSPARSTHCASFARGRRPHGRRGPTPGTGSTQSGSRVARRPWMSRVNSGAGSARRRGTRGPRADRRRWCGCLARTGDESPWRA